MGFFIPKNIRLQIVSNGRTIPSMLDELKQMPEYRTLESIRHFSISLEVFNGNYNELVHHLKIHNAPQASLELMGVDKRRLLHAYQREITRFLHNYIAAALSLTDHTRNHYRDLYSNNSRFPEYQEEINKRFVSNPLAVFIKDLRQYFQHYQMPGVSSRVVYTRGAPDFEMTLLLPARQMAKISGWNALSRKFLSKQGDDIDILALVNDFHALKNHSMNGLLADRWKYIKRKLKK